MTFAPGEDNCLRLSRERWAFIKKGDVLFIIESMKLMNEVQSEIEGTVAEILVGNGEAVEYDQPILRVE